MKHILRSRAKATRAWIERIQKLRPRYYDKDMTGLCARGAFRLAHRIQAAGLPAKVKVAEIYDGGGSHCYVVSGDYVLDVTCTQFKGPKVKVALKDRAADNMPYNPYGVGGRAVTHSSFKNPKRIFWKFRYWGKEWAPQAADFKRFDKKAYKRPK